MKKHHVLICKHTLALTFILASFKVNAFTCRDINGNNFNSSAWGASYTSNIYIDVKPEVGANENIIIRLGDFISCANNNPKQWNDYMDYGTSSSFGSGLNSFNGTITSFHPARYPFPPKNRVRAEEWVGTGAFIPLKGVLSLTPIAGASGVVINGGQTIAKVHMIKFATSRKNGSKSHDVPFEWNFIAKNRVTIPVGGCDVNTRNISVVMGDYPIDVSERNINLSVRCGKTTRLNFSLSGLTDTPTIFSNVAKNSQAKGIGIEMIRNGRPIPVNTAIPIGNVGTNFQSLNLKAKYALNGAKFVAGNVESVIGVNFTYN